MFYALRYDVRNTNKVFDFCPIKYLSASSNIAMWLLVVISYSIVARLDDSEAFTVLGNSFKSACFAFI